MKFIHTSIFALILTITFNSCQEQAQQQKETTAQAYTSHTPTAHHKVALEVLKASKVWTESFNKGNVKYCGNGYDDSAILSAKPFGIKTGKKDISEFWENLIVSGANNLVYSNVKIEIANATTAFLSANWSMNIGHGVIFQEKWEKKANKWVLTYDNFEVLEQFKTPKENTTNPLASHNVLEAVIKASITWTDGFNTGKSDVCGNGYSDNATMNPIPFPQVQDKKNIHSFWTKMIQDGATNLTYHNPTFEVMTDNSAVLSSQWSMNIGEGEHLPREMGKDK